MSTKTWAQWQALPQDATGALNPAPNYVLTVTATGCAGSTIVSSPAGISVGSGATATHSFPVGTVVTLTETPAPGCSFTGWSGAGTGTGPTRTVTMNSDASVTGTFAAAPPPSTWPPAAFTSQLGTADSWPGNIIPGYEPLTYILTVAVSGCAGSTVVSSPAGISVPSGSTQSFAFPPGTVVTLTGAPGTGCTGPTWSGDGTGTTTRSVTMDQARSVGATFASSGPSTHRLTVTATGGLGSTVVSSPAGISISSGQTASFDFPAGQVVVLTESPGSSARFSAWSGAGSGTGTTRTVTMTVDAAVTATFVTQYRLTVAVSGCAGSVVASSPAGISVASGSSGSALFDTGTVVTLTETPGSNCQFVAWSGAGTGTGTTRSVTMSADASVGASFQAAPPPPANYRLTVDAAGCAGSTIVSAPPGINVASGSSAFHDFAVGTTVVLTETPGPGCQLASWSGDGTGDGTERTVVLGADQAVTATFEAAPTPAPPAPSRTSFIGRPRLSFPGNIILGQGSTAAPPPSTFRLTLTVGGCSGSVVVSIPAGLSVPSGSQDYYDFAAGQVVTLTETPGPGCDPASWAGDGTGTGTQRTVTMDADRAIVATFGATVIPPPAPSVQRGTAPRRRRAATLPPIHWLVDGRPVDIDADWTAHATRMGGCDSFSGAARERAVRQWPSSFQAGALVQGFQGNGRPFWEGELALDPQIEDGRAALQADGFKIDAENATLPLLYQIRADTSLWSPGQGPPYNRTDSGSIDITIDPGALRYSITDGATVNVGAAAPATIWLPGSVLRRYAFTIDRNRSQSDYDIRVQTAPGPAGNIDGQFDHGLGGAQPTDIDSGALAVAVVHDCLVVRLIRNGLSQGNPESYLRVRLFDCRINDRAMGPDFDFFSTSDVVSDIALELGWDVSGVIPSSMNALPLLFTNGTAWSDDLSYVSALEDRRWRLRPRRSPRSGPLLEYGPHETVWRVSRAQDGRPTLPPLTRYAGVIVYYSQVNGAPAQVQVMDPAADPDQIGMWKETLSDPQPDDALATAVANNLLAKYTAPRRSGTVDIIGAHDSAGRGNPYDVFPGDLTDITDWDLGTDLVQVIEEMEWRSDGATVGINSATSAAGIIAAFVAAKARSGKKPRLPAGVH